MGIINIKQTIFILTYSLVNVLSSLGILYIINKTIKVSEDPLEDYTGILFFSIIIYSYLLNLYFQKKIIAFTYKFIYEKELNIVKKLLSTSLKGLEQIGTERIYGILEDIRIFIFFPNMLVNTLSSLLMVVLCISYLFILSVKGAIVVLALISIVASIYIFINKKLSKELNHLRNYNDTFNKYITDMLQGFKELKISHIRRFNLYDKYVNPNRTKAKEIDTFLSNNFTSINILSQYGLYLIFGFILFVIPRLGYINNNELMSFIIILLFMSGPINRLILMQNQYTRTSVANKRIKAFFTDLKICPIVRHISTSNEEIEFERIEFSECEYKYSNSQFILGPINLTIKKGEVVFIIGGNGSGKSTFINMLTGLYSPSKGEILFNNKKDIDYQNLLSVVFTNNYLFSRNYDDYSLNGNNEYRKLLDLMNLQEIIQDDSESSARRTFSKGQSKRMSLIFSLLENHPILVLDEWAADQDPYFRKYFYENLIPRLKKEGKTIIAVTHDDNYFKYADRLLKFDYGKITKDIKIKENNFEREVLWSN